MTLRWCHNTEVVSLWGVWWCVTAAGGTAVGAEMMASLMGGVVVCNSSEC